MLKKSMVAKIVVEAVIIAGCVILIISFFAFWVSIKPPRWPVTKTPADFGMQYEPVSFQSTDGITLAGWFVPAKNTSNATIIMMHGYPASKSDVVDLGVFLHEEYNLFFFDFRYMGESGGKYSTAGGLEIRDLQGAVRYLHQNKPLGSEKMGCWGFSLGAAVGLMAAAEEDSISAVVADSPYAELNRMVGFIFQRYGFLRRPFVFFTGTWSRVILGLNPADVAPAESVTKRPFAVLLIHGKQDSEISHEDSEMIYHNAAGPKEIWLIPDIGHGGAYFSNMQEYKDRVLGFFQRYLK